MKAVAKIGECGAFNWRRWSLFTSLSAPLHHEDQHISPASLLLESAPINLSITGVKIIRNENQTVATVVFVFPPQTSSSSPVDGGKMTSWVKRRRGSSLGRLDAGQVCITGPGTLISSASLPTPSFDFLCVLLALFCLSNLYSYRLARNQQQKTDMKPPERLCRD